jgi:type VI protein secretion system component VasF
MARGWESKDIESQITGAHAGADHGDPHYRSVAERELINKRAALMLDRERVSRELNSARNERFRQQLRAELEYINKQLAALEPQA